MQGAEHEGVGNPFGQYGHEPAGVDMGMSQPERQNRQAFLIYSEASQDLRIAGGNAELRI